MQYIISIYIKNRYYKKLIYITLFYNIKMYSHQNNNYKIDSVVNYLIEIKNKIRKEKINYDSFDTDTLDNMILILLNQVIKSRL